MYISNITHVNITNYLEISFQSVSDSVLVQQQQRVTSRNRSQPVESWSVGTSRNRLETVGTNRKKQTVGTSQNRAEPVGTGQSARFFFFFFWHKVLNIFWQDYNSEILIWVVNTCRYCGYQQISIDSLAVVARCGKMKLHWWPADEVRNQTFIKQCWGEINPKLLQRSAEIIT